MKLRVLQCCTLTGRNICRVAFIVAVVYAVFLLYAYHLKVYSVKSLDTDIEYLDQNKLKIPFTSKKTNYILLWTNKDSLPLNRMGQGNSAFLESKCSVTNCYVTDNKSYFTDQTQFDAVVFGALDTRELSSPDQLPTKRSPMQKYIFAASEPAEYSPACAPMFDGFYNWTWTYRLDSNVVWPYFNIFDMHDNIVGPSLDVRWPDKLDPISGITKIKLASKSKAAAWFVSHCSTKSGREIFVEELQQELKVYGLDVDVYGKCGTLSCSRNNEAACFQKLENDYYFYLSFENSFGEDYVTEKLLSALNNYAVPIVYGSANYSRFLPPGTYLDARALGAKELARKMNEIIADSTKYHDFFRWRNYYKYRNTYPLGEVCKLCMALNDEQKMSEVTVWKDFRTWWNGDRFKNNC